LTKPFIFSVAIFGTPLHMFHALLYLLHDSGMWEIQISHGTKYLTIHSTVWYFLNIFVFFVDKLRFL